MMNPNVSPGDRIILFHMEGELAVAPMTKGTVKSITRDPFEPEDSKIIQVDWDNGSKLALLSSTDFWKLDKEQIKEAIDYGSHLNFFRKNPHFTRDFDYKFFREYLETLRQAGPVNMFEASPFLYSGKEWIDRYHGEGREDDEKFQKLLEMADHAKDKMIQGTISYLERKKPEWELDDVNSAIRRLSNDVLNFWIIFH